MSPTPRVSLLVALFLVGTLATVGHGPAGAQEDDAEGLQHFRNWSVGDLWRYETRDTSANSAQTRGEIHQRVQSAERITNDRFFDPDKHHPEWRSHQVFRLKQWANLSSSTPQGTTLITSEKEMYHRTADLGQARSHQSDEMRVTAGYGFDGGSERIREYYPPRMELVFPFAVGDKWRAVAVTHGYNPGDDCGGEGMPGCNTTNHEVFTYTVLQTDTLTMRLNGEEQELLTYRILRLNELVVPDTSKPDEKRYQVWWWSPEVCNFVRKEEYKPDGTLETVITLKEYRCKGRDSPDPSYSSFDFENLSATRLHGELAVPWQMEQVAEIYDRADERSGFSFLQLGESIPGPQPFLLVMALVGLVVAARRSDRSSSDR